MKRYVLVSLPKNDDNNFVGEWRNRRNGNRWVYHAVTSIPRIQQGMVVVPSTEPHPIFVDDELRALEDLATEMTTTHPNYNWCIFDLLSVFSGSYPGEIKVVQKKITEKGMLP